MTLLKLGSSSEPDMFVADLDAGVVVHGNRDDAPQLWAYVRWCVEYARRMKRGLHAARIDMPMINARATAIQALLTEWQRGGDVGQMLRDLGESSRVALSIGPMASAVGNGGTTMIAISDGPPCSEAMAVAVRMSSIAVVGGVFPARVIDLPPLARSFSYPERN